MPDTPDPRPPTDIPPNEDSVDETIDTSSEVDEALYETFPASDAPGYTGGAATPGDYSDDDEDEA